MKKYRLFLLIFIVSIIAKGQNNAPGMDVIGRGYDVFGEYANISSIKRYPIFNFSKCNSIVQNEYNIPSIIYLEPYRKHDMKDVKGSSIEEYSKDLSEQTKLQAKALFFKGSMQSNFNFNSNESESRYYFTKMDLNLQWKISLDIRDTLELIKYLDDFFNKDLNSQTPEVIFQRYGTHVIASALLGGRIDFSLSQEITNNSNSTSVDKSINSKYKFIRGEMSSSDITSNGSYESNDNIKLNVIGGNSQYINDIKDNEKYKIWADGIQAKPTLCDFTEESLIPIWSLTTDSRVKEDLKNYYYNVWIKKYPIPEKAITKELKIIIDKVIIKNSCESAFKNYGEFQLYFYLNNFQKNKPYDLTLEKRGDEGQNCFFNKMYFKFPAPTNDGEIVSIKLLLVENDKVERDELTMGDKIEYYIKYPLNELIFNTSKTAYLYKEESVAGRYCEAYITYHLEKVR